MFGLKALTLASRTPLLQGRLLHRALLGGVRLYSGGDERTKLFLGNLSFVTNDDHVRAHFRDIDGITDVTIFMRDGRSKGCGLVEFKTREAAEKALRKYNESDLMGRTIYIREDMKSLNAKVCKDNVVSISNLPPTAAWQELKDIGRLFGKVARADIVSVENGSGIIVFETPADARRASQEIHGFKYNDYKLRAHVASDKEFEDPELGIAALETSSVSDEEVSDSDVGGLRKFQTKRKFHP
eukprot:Plantae.Rhodophyta-Purpureofilum_apyrenoidigerum.ctg10333.p1 GENE.Plantae.Rhodophyta-Purpureofilum_apyrenoidigerum.ctg10333~~Plantae.Rhodophyta-Purpureofilum_apyrenoidigerum.ctg10333.p1  ORF type:complete len:241 (+),score=44.26 Plantae.Rhodophyta-Purpureofilum_apyrenoidigerum.ctg10333:72-794(+)